MLTRVGSFDLLGACPVQVQVSRSVGRYIGEAPRPSCGEEERGGGRGGRLL